MSGFPPYSVLRCYDCKREFPLATSGGCPDCGGSLAVEGALSEDALHAPVTHGQGVWRFASALPRVRVDHQITLHEGNTPLIASERLARALDIRRLLLKDDARNPTGTFKDRALAIATSVAVDSGLAGLVCASTGNAGASTAAYAAAAGLPCVVLVPAAATPTKLAQAAVCGARLLVVNGTYSDAYRLASDVPRVMPYMNVTTTFVNPFATVGGKTVAYELHRELGRNVPDWIVVPIGVGPLLVGIHETYSELHAVGAIDRVPRLLAVQAAGCAPIVHAFERDADAVVGWGKPTTVVGALADPLNGYEREALITLRAIRESEGGAVAIDDDATLHWVRRVAQTEGLFVEPAAAITLAGVEVARTAGWIQEEHDVTCCLTGTGLKDPSVATSLVNPEVIEPTEGRLLSYLEQLALPGPV